MCNIVKVLDPCNDLTVPKTTYGSGIKAKTPTPKTQIKEGRARHQSKSDTHLGETPNPTWP